MVERQTHGDRAHPMHEQAVSGELRDPRGLARARHQETLEEVLPDLVHEGLRRVDPPHRRDDLREDAGLKLVLRGREPFGAGGREHELLQPGPLELRLQVGRGREVARPVREEQLL